jgi:hypothetical protein
MRVGVVCSMPFLCALGLRMRDTAREDIGFVASKVWGVQATGVRPLTEALDLARTGGYGTIERRTERALHG